MTTEELMAAIDALDPEAKQALMQLAVSASGASASASVSQSNFDVELEAFLSQLRTRSEYALNANIGQLKSLAIGASRGRPVQATVAATFAMTRNWIDLYSELVAPWKQFTHDVGSEE